MASKALTTKNDNADHQLAVMEADPNDIAEIISANLADASINDLDRVSCPTGGGSVWAVPDLEEEDGVTHIKELTGVILAHKKTRSFWEKSFDETGGGAPPDCYSLDGVHGHGTPGGPCELCPKAEFGTILRNGKPGRGQACKQSIQMMFLRETEMLPLIVTVPPTSLSACRKFLMRMAGKGRPPSAFVVGIKLTPASSKDGIKYSEFSFRLIRALTPEERERASWYTVQSKDVLSSGTLPPEDAIPENPTAGHADL